MLNISTLREYLQWEFADLVGKQQSAYGSTDPYEGGYRRGNGSQQSIAHEVLNPETCD